MKNSKINVGDVMYSSLEDDIFEVVGFGREQVYNKKSKRIALSHVIYYITNQGYIGVYARRRDVLKHFTKIGNL